MTDLLTEASCRIASEQGKGCESLTFLACGLHKHLGPKLEGPSPCFCLDWAPKYLILHHFSHQAFTATVSCPGWDWGCQVGGLVPQGLFILCKSNGETFWPGSAHCVELLLFNNNHKSHHLYESSIHALHWIKLFTNISLVCSRSSEKYVPISVPIFQMRKIRWPPVISLSSSQLCRGEGRLQCLEQRFRRGRWHSSLLSVQWLLSQGLTHLSIFFCPLSWYWVLLQRLLWGESGCPPPVPTREVGVGPGLKTHRKIWEGL